MNRFTKLLKNKYHSFRWIFSISRRFANVERQGKSAVATFLNSLGITFGVMTLIVVIGVMNGFQGTSINALLEISSSHVQAQKVSLEKELEFEEFCKSNEEIKSFSRYFETQALIVSAYGKQAPAIVRAVDENICKTDPDFLDKLDVYIGTFDVSPSDDEYEKIILGSDLANSMNVSLNSKINLLALSGSTDTETFSKNRKFKVCGIFQSGNLEINQTFAFTGYSAAKKYFGEGAEPVYGIKLLDYNLDSEVISEISEKFPEADLKSWKEFNRSFFSTLRIEKNIIFMLVFIIFIVVGINIYNGIRRLVYERSVEISTLSALGGKKTEIKTIFIMRGLLNGLTGAFWGTVLGLLLTINIGSIFIFLAEAQYYVEYFFMTIFTPETAEFLQKNQSFDIYATIPAVIYPSEIIFICLFGIFTPLVSSWIASRNVLNMNISEVLHED